MLAPMAAEALATLDVAPEVHCGHGQSLVASDRRPAGDRAEPGARGDRVPLVQVCTLQLRAPGADHHGARAAHHRGGGPASPGGLGRAGAYAVRATATAHAGRG